MPLLWYFATIFVVAVAVNFLWELAQASLFSGRESWGNIWWHCFVASLGDGVILWLIYTIGWLVFKQPAWFINPGVSGYLVMLMSGFILAITIEWGAVHMLQRWEYGAGMPIVPVLNIGLVPLLQMLVLPPLIFYIVGLWTSGRKRTALP
jgi:hypothetical protein